MTNRSCWTAVVLLTLSCALAVSLTPLHAEETGWKDTAELSYVVTAGNSESSTLGFKNTLGRAWERSAFTLKAGGIRIQTTTKSGTAFGTPDNFVVPETESTTAENYYLKGRYDRKITDRFFWYAGAGWDRNRFAGIDNRYIVEGGVGNIWYDTEDMKFRTDYALTFTDQEDVFPTPGLSDTFLGARFSWDYFHKFGANTEYVNSLVIDENLDETSDFRADMINSVSVSMSERLALKVSLQWLYDNEPAITVLPLVGPDPAPTVTVELDDLDTIFTAALVINF